MSHFLTWLRGQARHEPYRNWDRTGLEAALGAGPTPTWGSQSRSVTLTFRTEAGWALGPSSWRPAREWGPPPFPTSGGGATAVQGRTEGAEPPCGPAPSPQQRCPPPSGDLQRNLRSGRQLPHLCTAAVAVSSCAVCSHRRALHGGPGGPSAMAKCQSSPTWWQVGSGPRGSWWGQSWETLAECVGPQEVSPLLAAFTGWWRVSGGDFWNLRSGCDLGRGGQLPGLETDSQSRLCRSAVWPWARALPSLSLW